VSDRPTDPALAAAARRIKARAQKIAAGEEQPAGPRRMGPDGIVRPIEQDRELNSLFASFFRGRQAKKVLAYLRGITVNNVAGPAITDGELRHLEGQRFLYQVIEARIKMGKEKA
jgi:hypothetical protein